MSRSLERVSVGRAYPFGRDLGMKAYVTARTEREQGVLVDYFVVRSGVVKRRERCGEQAFLSQLRAGLPRYLTDLQRRSDSLRGSVWVARALHEARGLLDGEDLPESHLSGCLSVTVGVEVPEACGDAWALIDRLCDCEGAVSSVEGWGRVMYEMSWPLSDISALESDSRIRVVAVSPRRLIEAVAPDAPENKSCDLLEYVPWLDKVSAAVFLRYPTVELESERRVAANIAWREKVEPVFLKAVLEARLPEGMSLLPEGLDMDWRTSRPVIDWTEAERRATLVGAFSRVSSDGAAVAGRIRFEGTFDQGGEQILSLAAKDVLVPGRDILETPKPVRLSLRSRTVSKTVAAIRARYPANPINPRQIVLSDDAHPNGLAVIAIDSDVGGEACHLSEIVSFEPGKGDGSRALEIVMALARDNGEAITLIAKQFGRKGQGRLTTEQLRDWYARRGFECVGGDAQDGFDMMLPARRLEPGPSMG